MKILKAILVVLLFGIVAGCVVWGVYIIEGVYLKSRHIDIQMASWTLGLITGLLWGWVKDMYRDWQEDQRVSSVLSHMERRGTGT